MQAIKQLGLFWATIHEPPPDNLEKEAEFHAGDEILIEDQAVR